MNGIVFAVNDGTMLLPVGNMFDINGNETRDFHRVEALVARLPDNTWINVDDFDPLDLQRLA